MAKESCCDGEAVLGAAKKGGSEKSRSAKRAVVHRRVDSGNKNLGRASLNELGGRGECSLPNP